MSGLDGLPRAEETFIHKLHTSVHRTPRSHLGLLSPVDSIGDDHQRIVLPGAHSERVCDRVTWKVDKSFVECVLI